MGTGGIGYTFIALPALLLLTGCFGIPAATDPSAIAPAAVVAAGACSESGADAKDPKAREAVCLKELGKQASRKGNVLSLKLDDGTAKTFRTKTAGCRTDVPTAGTCEEYRLVGFYPMPGAYLLLKQGFEFYEFKAVNIHTGETKDVEGVPRLAPDNATFLVKSCNDGCSISIKSMASSDPPAWKTSSPDTDADWEFVRWIDNDQVALRIVGKSQRCPQGDCQAILKRAGSSWTIESSTPKG